MLSFLNDSFKKSHAIEEIGENMYTAFVSCSLDKVDRDIVNRFRWLLQRCGITPRTVGIDIVPKAREETPYLVKDEISKSDCIVAILTPRYLVDGYISSVWTYLEPGMGFMVDKPHYVFYEKGIKLEGILRYHTPVWDVAFSCEQLNDPEELQKLMVCVWSIQRELDLERCRGGYLGLGLFTGGLGLIGGYFLGKSKGKKE